MEGFHLNIPDRTCVASLAGESVLDDTETVVGNLFHDEMLCLARMLIYRHCAASYATKLENVIIVAQKAGR